MVLSMHELRDYLNAIAGIIDSTGPWSAQQPQRWWKTHPRLYRCGKGHVGTGSHTCTGATTCAWGAMLTFPGDRTGDLPRIEVGDVHAVVVTPVRPIR